MSSDLIATITNTLGCDVDIYDVFDPNTKPAPGTSVALTYTKLATVAKGATAQQVQTIHPASHLQAMITGNIAALNNNYYQQFPVAVMGTSRFSSLDFTLTSDMQQNMVDSFQFIKYMQANPSTALAKGFRSALASKNNTDSINTFFKGTGSFQQCTFSTWNAVFTWQSQFTSPWQGTYYLYNMDSSSANSTADPSAPTLVATLAITASAEDSSAVLTMAAKGGQSTPIAMPGDGSMQEQNVGTGTLAVSLNPAWLNVLQTSQKTGDSYTVIGAAFTGTINNAKVAGNLDKLVIPSIPSTSLSFGDVMSSTSHYSDKFGSLVGILVGIATVSIMFKDSKAAERQRTLDAQKDAKSEADAKAKGLKIKEEEDAKFQSQLRTQGPAAEAKASEAAGAYDEAAVALNVQKDMTGVAKEGEKLSQVLNDGAANSDIEETASDLGKAEDDLDQAGETGTSEAAAQADVKQADDTIVDTSEKLSSEVQSEDNTASQGEKKAEQDVKEVDEEVKKQAEDTEKVEEKQEAEDKEAASKDVDSKDFGDAKPQDEGEHIEAEGK
ncbi:hypothetical protein ACHAPA_010475 [Fusarium lateritium]